MRSVLAAALLAVSSLLAAPPSLAEPFRFVALGDMPYGDKAEVYPPFEALIARINQMQPAFTLHVGDIKSSVTPCDDAMFAEQLAFMNRFEAALDLYAGGQ